jgi:hypothetical protein
MSTGRVTVVVATERLVSITPMAVSAVTRSLLPGSAGVSPSWLDRVIPRSPGAP